MRFATWNVNSVRARLENVKNWLQTAAPDVLLLQEIKCEDTAFPVMDFKELGYHALVVGQKSYNGVAILSKSEAQDVLTRLPGDDADDQARYLEATIEGVRVASIYLPNGNPADSEKFPAKLAWMARLEARAKELLALEIPLVWGGDMNVIPSPADVYDPAAWAGDALFRPEVRAAYRRLRLLGLTDAFRALHPTARHAYSFWDYQAGAWPRDMGLRIDHFLLSPEAADRLVSCEIDRAPRGEEKASDHTPVVLDLL